MCYFRWAVHKGGILYRNYQACPKNIGVPMSGKRPTPELKEQTLEVGRVRLVSSRKFHTRHSGATHTGRHHMKIVSRVLGGILLSFLATSAGATIIFNAIPSGTGNNVQFNDQPPNQSGTTIFGNINDPNDTLVQFTSTQILRTPSLGQARIESFPDGILNNLTTTIPGLLLRPSRLQP